MNEGPSNEAEPTSDAHDCGDESAPERTLRSQGLRRLGPVRRLLWVRQQLQHETSPIALRWDDRENAEGRLPADERVSVPIVWIAELYTPATVNGLLDGIDRLGWEYRRGIDDSLIEWTADVRAERTAGWTRIGLVAPKGSGAYWRDQVADLPDGVAAAMPDLISLTPSVTALVVGFILDDQGAAAIMGPATAEFSTFVELSRDSRYGAMARYILRGGDLRLGHVYHRPDTQRRKAIRATFDDLEGRCADWVSMHFPGALSASVRSGPARAAVVVTEVAEPLVGSFASSRCAAADAIGLSPSYSYDAWETTEWPGCRMTLPRTWNDGTDHVLFAGRRAELFAPSAGDPDPGSNWTGSQGTRDNVPGLMSRWAAIRLLDAFIAELADARDGTAGDNANRAIGDLKRARRLVRSSAYDMQVVSRELADLAADKHLFGWHVLDMTYADSDSDSDKPPLLSREIRHRISERAMQVQTGADLLVSTVAAVANFTQTISNIRIQRLVVFLTFVSLAVAIVALIVALKAG